jgi:hypothetical protein
MGKTSCARYLASELAQRCRSDYSARIPILISLGDYTTAPNIEMLIYAQLTHYHGVRHFSAATFKILNDQQRFVLILDGFDEMKFAMAPNDFAYFSSEVRRLAAANPNLMLLGRPDAVIGEEEIGRLLSSRLVSHDISVRAGDGPDFANYRLAFLLKPQYIELVSGFLRAELKSTPENDKYISEVTSELTDVSLGDILSRPVQSKMLADILVDRDVKIQGMPRFTLYDLFVRKTLRREEEKASRKHLSSEDRLRFMRRRRREAKRCDFPRIDPKIAP